jgi:transcriptional regulator with XRE-family HTH domain
MEFVVLKEIFGENVRKRREALNFERKRLALKSGVGVSNIGYIEKNNTTLDVVEKLSKALSIPPWMMLTNHSETSSVDLPFLCEKFEFLNDVDRKKVLVYLDDLLRGYK